MAGAGVLIAIFGLGLLIFIHEMGHFVSGKLLRLKITEFFLGLPIGKPLIKFRRGETVYGIKPVLFGGYVKFPEFLNLKELTIERVAKDGPARTAGIKTGDKIKSINGKEPADWLEVYHLIVDRPGKLVELLVDRDGELLAVSVEIGLRNGGGWLGLGPAATDKVTIEDLPVTMEGQTLWRKALVVAAGPAMNIALAIVLIAGALMIGFAEPTTTVGRVIAGGPAAKAGIKPGDRVVKIDNVKISTWQDVIKAIQARAGKRTEVTFVRDGKSLTVSPVFRKSSKRGLLGIATKLERRPKGFMVAMRESLRFSYTATGIILGFLAKLVTAPASVVGQLRSPIGVVQETAPIAQRDILEYVATLSGISLAIGIFNFLPIPPLDGGRIFISAVEFIIRRPLQKDVLALINIVGVSLLLVLMTYVIAADLFRLAVPGA